VEEILYVMAIHKSSTGYVLTKYNEKQLFNGVKREVSTLPFIMKMNI
jgi:hypothetical protein